MASTRRSLPPVKKSVVGRENIVVSTDCGLGSLATLSNVEPEIAWAKLGSLVEGARLASNALW